MNINFRFAVAISLGLILALLVLWLFGVLSTHVSADTSYLTMTGSETPPQVRGAKVLTTTVLISSDAGSHNSLAADSIGRLHVSFNNATDNTLYYAVFSDTTWQVEEVDSQGEILRNSIAVNPGDNNPHISYNKNGDLRYAYKNISWALSTVATRTLTQIHRQNAIAVDSTGDRHIAYSTDWQDSGKYWMSNIEYAKLNGGAWEPQILEQGQAGTPKSEVASPPISLILDSKDDPWVLYKKRYSGGQFGVRLQEWVSPTWQLTELEPHVWYNTYPPGAALTIDRNDNVYWTYMWKGQKVGGTNLSTTVLASGEKVGYSDIVARDAGQVYVVFQNDNILQLSVKPASACDWIHVPLISISERESDVSLAVIENIIHVIYYDGASQSLNHLSMPIDSIFRPIVAKLAYPSPVQDGSLLTYTLHITNFSNITLTATITDFLPDHVIPSGIQFWPSTVITPCGIWTKELVVTVETGYTGSLTNKVQFTAEEGPRHADRVTVCANYCISYLPIILKKS